MSEQVHWGACPILQRCLQSCCSLTSARSGCAGCVATCDVYVCHPAAGCALLPPTAATLDPLGIEERPKVKELDPAYYGFTEKDLDRE